MADCGMGVAVDIRVIREHVLRFLSARWRGGYDEGAFITKAFGDYCFAGLRRKECRERRMILSANLAWGEIAA
jgi:hypothetical protein